MLGLLVLGIALACFAWWFQWRQTRRCLALYGSAAARAIAVAPRVELWELGPRTGGLAVVGRRDISRAAGLVHLRRGLVEDANFDWSRGRDAGRLPLEAWDCGLAFFSSPEASQPTAILAIDFAAAGGSMTVVGRPGRVGLGRLERGLGKWIEATRAGAPTRGQGL